jgi:acyl dehydratase
MNMPKIDDSIVPGLRLPALKKTITQRNIDYYSGVRPHSIHTDPEWAKAKGFAAPLAQALMSTAYVSQMMTTWLGEGFVVGGKISASFIKPVLSGETLTAQAVVKAVEQIDGRCYVSVECWCENSQGDKTMVGSASGFSDHIRQPVLSS